MSGQTIKTTQRRVVVAIGAAGFTVLACLMVLGLLRHAFEQSDWFMAVFLGVCASYMWAWALLPSKPGGSTPCVRS